MSSRALDVVREGALHVFRHPLRSGLSAFTCAVAIAVTVNVISLVHGLDEDIRRDVARFGRRTVDVGRFPTLLPAARREPLGPAELERIRGLLADLSPALAPRRQAVARAVGDVAAPSLSVVAAPPEYVATLDVRVLAGRWLAPGDDPATSCALDASAASLLFPRRRPAEVLGRTVRLETTSGTVERRVLGVLEDPLTYRALFETFDEGRGSRTLTSALLSFRNVYVPLAALPGDEFSGISVVLPREDDVAEAARRLREAWPPGSDDPLLSTASVGVFVRREWMDAVGATSSAGAFLGNIVWIIVVGVAAVMLSTLNLMTIRERYDEIAIRRCEGARRRDVAAQVTVEGTILSLAGGLAGLPLGYVGAAVLREIVRFPFRFEIRWAGVATLVAVALGLLASVLPAWRAARLQPAAVLTRRLT